MAPRDQLLASALVRRLRENQAANDRGEIAGRNVGDIPLLGGLLSGKNTPLGAQGLSPVGLANAAGLGLEGAQNIGRALTGAMLAQSGRVAEHTPLDELLTAPGVGAVAKTLPIVGAFAQLAQMPGFLDAARQAREGQNAASGNPYERAMAANEAGARGNEKTVGLINAVYDPSNALGGLGKVAQAHRLKGVAEALLAVDRAQALPFEAAAALAKGVGRTGAPVAREAAERVAAAFRHTPENSGALQTAKGGVPVTQLPTIGGARQYGPVPTVEASDQIRGRIMGEAAQDLPLAPNVSDFQRYAKAADLPRLPAQVEPERSPLVPRNFSIVRAARELGERTPTPIRPEVNTNQLPLPPESGVIPPELERIGLHRDQLDFLDELRGTIERGDPKEIAAARALAVGGMEIPEDRVARVVDEVYATLNAEDKAARIAAIEESPYFGAFPYFNQAGELKRVNPITKQRIKYSSREEVWNRAGSGYDDLAASLLEPFEGHNQNFGTTADDFWTNAREALQEYRALKAPPRASAPLTPDAPIQTSGNTGVPAADRLRAFLRGEEERVGLAYLPNDPKFYRDKGGIAEADLPGALEALIADGTLGRQPDGGLALRPTTAAPTPRETGVPELPDVDPNEVPDDALSLADEAAARANWENVGDTPDPATLRGGDFTPDELDTLVNLAYPVEQAQASAITKYTDPTDLANAAIRRITASPTAVRRLGAQDPILAEKIAYHQLPGEEALPEVAEEIAPKPLPRGQGGDMAAGGGMGIIAPALGRTAGGAASGAVMGGIAGGAAPAEDGEDRLNQILAGAAGGALLGGSGGAGGSMAARAITDVMDNPGSAIRGALANRPVLSNALDMGVAEQRAANAAMTEGKTHILPGVRDLVNIWRSNTVTHFKNLFGDEGSGRLFLRGAQGKGASELLAPIRKQYADRLKLATEWEREPAIIQDALTAIGKEGYTLKLGDSLAQAEKGIANKVRSTSQEAIGAAFLSAINPAGFAQTVGGVAASGALGTVRPALRGMFRGINDFQQATFRRAAFADELNTTLAVAADTLLPRLEAAGADVSSLAGRGGKFTPAEVAAVADGQAADRWQALTDKAVGLAEQRARFVFGDYSKRSGFERALGGVVPFASWAIRAYPVAVTMAAQHPGVALAVYHLLDATSQGAGKDGRPGYTAGMVPITSDTPLVGPIVRAMLGGQDGTLYADPIGSFSPVGGDLFQPEEPGEKNWYQEANAWLGRVGLPQANPAVQAGAYVLGLDYKAPGALSRTQGLENALAQVPGNAQLPDVGGGVLRTARAAISPIAEGIGIPGAKGDKYPTAYDPITRRYAELVLAETKKPLDDQSNRAYLVAMSDPRNELMQQARREVLLGGAARNASSLTNPIGTVTQGADARTNRAAKEALPFTYERIAKAPPYLAAQMKARNEQEIKANPAAAAYKIGNQSDRTEALLADWERRHSLLKREAPTSYKQRRQEYIDSLR